MTELIGKLVIAFIVLFVAISIVKVMFPLIAGFLIFVLAVCVALYVGKQFMRYITR